MSIFESDEERTGFKIESNFVHGRGYVFYGNGDVATIERIINKYSDAANDFPDSADDLIKKWWDLLSPNEKAMIQVSQKRTHRAVVDPQSVDSIIQEGGFQQFTRTDVFTKK